MEGYLEIIDTAVKIGLGAFITGFSTYLLAARKFRYELSTNKAEKRIELARDACLEFEKANAAFNELVYEVIRANNIGKITPENFEKISNLLINFKKSLNHSETLTRLAGLVELAESFSEYTIGIDKIHGAFTNTGFVEYKEINKVVAEFESLVPTTNKLMAEVFDEIYS